MSAGIVMSALLLVSVELLRFALAYEQQNLGQTTLTGTGRAIEAIYRNDGYLLAEARATLDSASGRLSIHVREGYIDRSSIEGFRQAVAERIKTSLAPLLRVRPLRQHEFERAFMLASDLSGVYVRSDFSFEPDRDVALLRISGTESRHVEFPTGDGGSCGRIRQRLRM